MFVATLIAPGRLAYGDVDEARDRLAAAGCAPGGWTWLEEGRAADIGFAVELSGGRKALAGLAAIDTVAQPAAGREKRLLVADMDSTMIGQECIDELADYAGIKPQVAAITERAMQGEIDFAAALAERVALLKGLDEGVVADCLAERIRISPGAKSLVRTMQGRGAETILVSGGFTAFVEPVARAIGFDRFEANVLSVRGGKLTGTTDGRTVDSSAKRAALVEARQRLGLMRADTLAVGDGANDMAMVEEAGLGVAYRSKPALAEVADARIDHCDLTALLWAQGIARSEWRGSA